MSKATILVLAGMLVLGAAAAEAQTPLTKDAGRYAEFTFGATAGHTTGALVGGEFGWPLNLTWDVFFEAGRMFNTKPASMDSSAGVIADYLIAVAGSASYEAKQPATYLDGGVRYKFPPTGRFDPYIEGALGGAHVARNVTFIVNGASQSSQQLLDNYGVQLGTDLSGTETKPILTFGVGSRFRISNSLFGDVSYRYGRIFLAEAGLNTNRLQFGVGLKF
jgi:opacity protein-like surface antigen